MRVTAGSPVVLMSACYQRTEGGRPLIVDSYRIDLPATWRRVPTNADELKRTIREKMDPLEWAGLSVVQRRNIELFSERVAADLRRTDAKLAAVFAEIVSADEGAADGTDPQGALLAALLVSSMTRQAIGSKLPLTANIIQAAMSKGISDEADVVLAATRVTRLAPPSVVRLSSGDACRIIRLHENGHGSSKMATFTETYFIPVPDDYESLLVLLFATPNVKESATFSQLFAEIADHVKMYREGESTTL